MLDESAAADVRDRAARIFALAAGATPVLQFGDGASTLGPYPGAEQCSIAGLASADEVREKLAAEFSPGSFEAILLGDALGQLADPVSLLRCVREYLRPGGSVVAVIPNVAHGAVRLALLQGRFPGAFPRTAAPSTLHFFTRDSIETLFADAGYEITEWQRTVHPIFEPSPALPPIEADAFSADVIEHVRADAESETLEFFVRAQAVEIERSHADLMRELARLKDELAARTAGIASMTASASGRLQVENERARWQAELRSREIEHYAELERLENVIAQLQASESEARAEIASLRSGTARLESELAAAAREIESGQSELARLREFVERNFTERREQMAQLAARIARP